MLFQSVKPYLRTQIDAYKKQTHHTFLETIFGGLLINTILCLKCRKSSQNFEPFVDISLSIATPRPVKMPAPAQRKPDPIMDELEEKYGTKKGASLNKLKLNNKKAKKKVGSKYIIPISISPACHIYVNVIYAQNLFLKA